MTTETSPDSADPLSGTIVSRKWRLGAPIGRGGMGRVFEAQNLDLPKKVAIKIVDGLHDAEVAERLRREAEAASLIESPHVVSVFDCGSMDDGRPYIVMELLRGESLGARLRRDGKLEVPEVVRIVEQILKGLEKAHAAGVVHRDLKPDNVFLENHDGEPFVKLLDFGISKRLLTAGEPGPATLTQKGAVLGTPHYMSPEQAHGEPDLDARTDLFSLGAIAYECLVGKPPHAGLPSYEAVVVAICTREPAPLRELRPEVPAALAKLVDRLLDKDRNTRFATARDVREALSVAAPDLVRRPDLGRTTGDRPAQSVDPSPTKSSWTGRTRGERQPSRGAAIGGAVIAAALALGVTLYLRQPSPSPTPPPLQAKPAGGAVRIKIATTPPGARVVVDGEERADGVIEGAPLSEHQVEVSLAGFVTESRTVRLDGRAELAVELAPLPSASASRGPAVRKPGAAPSAPTTGTATGHPTSPPAGAGGGSGLKLKVDP